MKYYKKNRSNVRVESVVRVRQIVPLLEAYCPVNSDTVVALFM